MNKHILISIVIAVVPTLLILLGRSGSEVVGNMAQIAELLYLSPGLIAQDKLFGFQKDIGLIPTDLGRLLVTGFYLALYWSMVFLLRKRTNS